VSPEGVPYADYSNPQSLNLYNYTLDNPETNVDLDGAGGASLRRLHRLIFRVAGGAGVERRVAHPYGGSTA